MRINPGASPEFDISKEVSFKQYKITYNNESQDNGWGSGKKWKLIEHQIDEQFGKNNSIPKLWTKTNGKSTLKRKLEYDSYLKTKEGKTQGKYDLYSYTVMKHKSETEIALTTPENKCLWADFDNYGRLVASFGSNIIIYKSNSEILNGTPSMIYNLEALITLSNENEE